MKFEVCAIAMEEHLLGPMDTEGRGSLGVSRAHI